MASRSNDLSSLLTPSLFHGVFKNRIPYAISEPLNFSEIFISLFRSEDESSTKELRDLCYPVLKRLSTLGLNNVPDLMSFLPSPEAEDFLVQAFGLQLLLDQGPRALFTGIDVRYRNGYFDIISQKFANQLLSLPSDLRIDSQTRWLDERGATFGYWVVLQLFVIAPFGHSEHLSNQELALGLLEEVRVTVEKYSGKPDPYREDKEAKHDTFALTRLFTAGPVGWQDGLTTMEDFAFWLWALMSSRHPIIEKFGRNPFANETTGRVSTDEEEKWMAESRKGRDDGAIKAAQEIQKRIREDVLVGRWTPLGEQ